MSRYSEGGFILEEGKFYTNKSGKTRYLYFINRNAHTFEVTISWSKGKFSETRLCSAKAFVRWLKS